MLPTCERRGNKCCSGSGCGCSAGCFNCECCCCWKALATRSIDATSGATSMSCSSSCKPLDGSQSPGSEQSSSSSPGPTPSVPRESTLARELPSCLLPADSVPCGMPSAPPPNDTKGGAPSGKPSNDPGEATGTEDSFSVEGVSEDEGGVPVAETDGSRDADDRREPPEPRVCASLRTLVFHQAWTCAYCTRNFTARSGACCSNENMSTSRGFLYPAAHSCLADCKIFCASVSCLPAT
mmetsp:Transcript_41406/g.109275  ORF Transcript_41406/g.109275 Transcript_41406/m.109275 type:complete len:238 (-) Transcript_41406:447-1160(-)